jgi:hypothetical protein
MHMLYTNILIFNSNTFQTQGFYEDGCLVGRSVANTLFYLLDC